MKLLTLLALSLLLGPLAASAQKFYPDDPIGRDRDDLPSARPARVELSQVYDLLENTFLARSPGPIPRAENVNTLGEVPDSSWFTNRMGSHTMGIDAILRGPRELSGLDRSRPWTVIAAKSEGITPGFTLRDGAGEIFFVKLDPRRYPNLVTAAELIGTLFFHAFGYNVPEAYLIHFGPEDLHIDPGVTIADANGGYRPMTPLDMANLLKKAPAGPDGLVRAVASRRLRGEPLGPFEYRGTRSDDPNDIFPHENRRELRGLRVFSAWLNHDDSRAINTLDTFIETGPEGGFVKHHLIDFGSTLGSGSIGPQDPRAGNEYKIERGPALRSALTLGLWDRPWRRVKYPAFPEVGRFESDSFDPRKWRPEYPNPAFDRCDPGDGFWAARIIMKFTDQTVRAIVAAGELSDPEAEEYLARTLIGRRDKIVRHYLSLLNPLAAFRLEGGALHFENLGVTAGLAARASYEFEWLRFDNETGETASLGRVQTVNEPSLPLPPPGGEFLLARIRTISPEWPAWKTAVDVYIRSRPETSIVGIEREYY